jgi:iron complex transport system permease protein
MPKNKPLAIILLALAALAAVLASLMLGGSGLGASEVLSGLFNPNSGDILSTIIWKIRLPRVVLAVFVGMGLAGSGCV